jgi:hypothetical protein
MPGTNDLGDAMQQPSLRQSARHDMMAAGLQWTRIGVYL